MKRELLGVVVVVVMAAGVFSCHDLDAFGPTDGNEADGATADGPAVVEATDGASTLDATADAGRDSGLTDATVADVTPDQLSVDSSTPDANDGAPSPSISLSSSAIDFGYVGCGTQASPMAVVITNNGAVSEQITETLLNGGTSFTAELETPGGPALTATLAPTQTVTMLVSAFPVPAISSVAPDFYRGTIALTVDPPLANAPQIPITETALGAILQLTPAVAPFGPVEAGATATLPFQLVNVGNAATSVTLELYGVGFSSPSLDGGLAVVEAGAASFSVQYSAATPAASFGALSLGVTNLCGPDPSATLLAGSASIVATGQDTPAGIAVDSTSVYWTNSAYIDGISGSVMKASIASLADGGTPTTLASGQLEPVAVAVDGANLYWADIGGPLMKIPVGGGGAGAIVPDAGVSLGAEIALDDTNLYWAGNGNVMAVPKAGGTPTTLASGQMGAFSVAVDSTSIYWTSTGSGNGTGTVMKAPLSGVPDGGTATTLASALMGPSAIAVDATSVYWITTLSAGASVMRLPLSGAADGGTTTLASLPEGPLADVAGLAVDANNLYVACSTLLLGVPLDGGAPVTLATGSLLASVAQNDAGVYWTDALGFREVGSSGVVLSIPK